MRLRKLLTGLIIFHIVEIKVLLYDDKDTGLWVAHALEMDILAEGKTESDALRGIIDLIHYQISFAAQKKDDSLIFFPAPKEYFDRWEAALSSHIY